MPSTPIARPRTKPAEERRDDLMSSAERIFLQKGVEQTTIEDITIGANVSKGAFYLHFSSKADVVEALRARFVEGLLDGIAAAAVGRQRRGDWQEKLSAWSRSCAAGYLDSARVHHLVFAAAPPPSREGLTRNILIDDLMALLASGNRARAWSVDDPSFTAVFLFNALHGVVNQTDVAGNADDRSKLLADIEAHFRRAVGA
jgi:AcrR family transcriptional regulator